LSHVCDAINSNYFDLGVPNVVSLLIVSSSGLGKNVVSDDKYLLKSITKLVTYDTSNINIDNLSSLIAINLDETKIKTEIEHIKFLENIIATNLNLVSYGQEILSHDLQNHMIKILYILKSHTIETFGLTPIVLEGITSPLLTNYGSAIGIRYYPSEQNIDDTF